MFSPGNGKGIDVSVSASV